MSFYRRVKYFLVHALSYTNKVAQELIDQGKIELDGKTIYTNCLLEDDQEIKVNREIVRAKKEYVYLRFNKPLGFESTLNVDVSDNLAGFFGNYRDLAIAGRLDKKSEGLMLLSNDGKWVEKMCNPKFEKEKEYVVNLDKEPDEAFITLFSSGVKIGRYVTNPCECKIVSGLTINVILKEGKNRQIRRMAKALGYSVVKLKRVRIGNIGLDSLESGALEQIVII